MASKDEAVINPSLLKPEWSDLSKFEYNPDFDIGYMDWIEEAIAEEEQGWLDNTDVSFTDDVAGLVDDEDVSEPEVKPKPKHLRCECLFKDSSNTAGKKPQFGVPVSSPQRKKAARGIVLLVTSSQALICFNREQSCHVSLILIVTFCHLFD